MSDCRQHELLPCHGECRAPVCYYQELAQANLAVARVYQASDNRPALTVGVAREWLTKGPPDWGTIVHSYAGVEKRRFDLGTMPDIMSREMWVRGVSFAIPCAEAIAVIAHSRRLIEVGAGTGYWSALLARLGVDVRASDVTEGISDYGQHVGRFHPVEIVPDAARFVRRLRLRDVLMVWPGHEEPWPEDVLRAMAPNRRLYIISEGAGGCVGTEAMFAMLDAKFEELDEVPIPCWYGMHDRLGIYRKLP